MEVFSRWFAKTYAKMTLITRSGFSTNAEVEASSFSVWNCVITFLQILLVSTILYGAGWNQGLMYNIFPDNSIKYSSLHFRTIAFFFCVWALQSVGLALLLVWAIGKRSYHLCHSWIRCEVLMQIFIILSGVYFAYRSFLQNDSDSSVHLTLLDSNNRMVISTTNTTQQHFHKTFTPPRHISFLVALHFLTKGFGFWIIWRYMKLLKTTAPRLVNSNEVDSNATRNEGISSNHHSSRKTSPPPAYSHLCKDDLPCYDEALKLCQKESVDDTNKFSHFKSKIPPV